MEEYSWPPEGAQLGELARRCWLETVAALPVGSVVVGEVVGRQPFGVFVEIKGMEGAVGLAEVISMPRDQALPPLGAVVRGVVIDHAAHNNQVRLRLTA